MESNNFDILETFSCLKHFYGSLQEPICQHHGITRLELDILLFLANNPHHDTATDIINRRNLTKSHVSMSIADLIGRGLLERFYLSENRRTIHLRLLPAANSIIIDGWKAQHEFLSVLWNGFTPQETAQAQNLLSRMGDNLQQALTHASKAET